MWEAYKKYTATASVEYDDDEFVWRSDMVKIREALNELYLGNRDFKSLQHIVGTSLCILQNR